ncbi:hypothetical protein [Janthinobacterium sp. BJB304]|uniref:hypothetical protein n=1 Tax=Janthinobacterium sp. BJB304 TaxID=1572871 RepID=UPI000C118387|nr:hypothetical protein [Janthinobacterium sp. BJB304]PHV35899.1 hypothetical protein CSQ95_27370 [Janthinobacterium sp. BJB304]
MNHAHIVELLKAATSPDKGILLDDGKFYIEHNTNCDPAEGNGFRKRRCKTSRQTPGGWDAVVGYDLPMPERGLCAPAVELRLRLTQHGT